MENIFLLGASGSIGAQTLSIIRNSDEYCLKSISVGHNINAAMAIIEEFAPEFVSVLCLKDKDYLQKKYPEVIFACGEEGLIQAATYGSSTGLLINAVVGIIGLAPTLAAIKQKRDVLLANKETLVTGGSLVMAAAREYGVEVFPIDSEHSAIYQCLLGGNSEDVAALIITASGGSFRDKIRAELAEVTVAEALKHPNWSMGKKITIDSATMVNKGLEVIEAHHLFNMPYDKIKTIIHPESIIHSMVEYNDGAIIAQMSNPNMMLPIQYALNYPRHLQNDKLTRIDFLKTKNLSFQEMDFIRFPMLELAYIVGAKGGLLPTVYNAANEAAVDLFIKQKIKFLVIEEIIKEMVGLYQENNKIDITLEDILEVDNKVKKFIYEKYEVE
ncbi:MAG TPA: 1-deoxy-D-xylulose-5-phosphate reductoisomerase [Bacilli bacterium]|nr:1-deoxy-D-xylulose-5-phosphate reductoisomerase [Bacilli bacterium]